MCFYIKIKKTFINSSFGYYCQQNVSGCVLQASAGGRGKPAKMQKKGRKAAKK